MSEIDVDKRCLIEKLQSQLLESTNEGVTGSRLLDLKRKPHYKRVFPGKTNG